MALLAPLNTLGNAISRVQSAVTKATRIYPMSSDIPSASTSNTPAPGPLHSSSFQEIYQEHVGDANCGDMRHCLDGHWRLLSGGSDGLIMWDLEAKKVEWKAATATVLPADPNHNVLADENTDDDEVQQADSAVMSCSWLSETSWVSGHYSGHLIFWQKTQTGPTVVRAFKAHADTIIRVEAFCKGTRVLTTSMDKMAYVWEVPSGQLLVKFPRHDNEVTGAAVLEDGSVAFTTAEVVPEVANAYLWNPATGELLHELEGHTGWLWGLALNKPRNVAVAVGHHSTLFVWDIPTGQLVFKKLVADGGQQNAMSLTPDGCFAVMGSQEGVVRVLETFFGTELTRFDATWVDSKFHPMRACFFCDEVHDDPRKWEAKFLRDGGTLKDIFDWDTQAEVHRTLSPEVPFGRRVCSIGTDGTVRVWSLQGDMLLKELYKHPHMPNELALSLDSTLMSTITENEGMVRIFNLATGALIMQWSAHQGFNGYDVVFGEDATLMSPVDGPCEAASCSGRVYTCSDDRLIKLWNLSDMKCFGVLRAHTAAVTQLCVVPGKEQLLSGSADKSIIMWDVKSKRMVRKFKSQHEDAISYIIMAPNGKDFLSTSMDHTSKLWDMETGMVTTEFIGHTAGVRHATWSADGTQLVTASMDTTVRVWNVSNGKEVIQFRGHTKTVMRVRFLNQFLVVSASRDGTIRCWDLERERTLPMVQSQALLNDSYEAVVVLPSKRADLGFGYIVASTKSGRLVIVDPTYRQPLPARLLPQLDPDRKLLNTSDVEKLMEDFPGMPVLPLPDGNSLLHIAAREGNTALLKALTAKTSPDCPMVLNFEGLTPLDLAVQHGHRRCVELLLSTELLREPSKRLAVLKAWRPIAEETPYLLESFLDAMGLENALNNSDAAIFAPLQVSQELLAISSPEYQLEEDVWYRNIEELRAGYKKRPWYGYYYPWNQAYDIEEKPTVAAVVGLPYIACSGRSMNATPMGLLVQHGMSKALGTDVIYSVLEYKWRKFAFNSFMRESVWYVFMVLCYGVATSLSVYRSREVIRDKLYDFKVPAVCVRVAFEALLSIANLGTIFHELMQMRANGMYSYFTGGQGSWNLVEFWSSMGVQTYLVLQILSISWSRFVMSLTTVLLGFRLLKVASGPESTGVFVQMILRIIYDLRFFMLVLVTIILTFGLSFFQVMSILASEDDPHRGGGGSDYSFTTLPYAIVAMYFYMLGDVTGTMGDGSPNPVWQWYVKLLVITFTFLVSIILLNLLIAIMSDTYAIVKEHAKSEWLLLRAKLIMEIEASMPDAFFADKTKSQPKWLHCLKVEALTGDESLIESIRGPVARQALNTDLFKLKQELSEGISAVKDQLRLLRADVEKIEVHK